MVVQQQRPIPHKHWNGEIVASYIYLRVFKKTKRYLRIENTEGYVLIAVYLYACVRVIRINQKVFNRSA